MLTSREAVNELLEAIDNVVAAMEAPRWRSGDTSIVVQAVGDARDTARYIREAVDAEASGE